MRSGVQRARARRVRIAIATAAGLAMSTAAAQPTVDAGGSPWHDAARAVARVSGAIAWSVQAVAVAIATPPARDPGKIFGGRPLAALRQGDGDRALHVTVFGGAPLPALHVTVIGGDPLPATERDRFADLVAVDLAGGGLCTGLAIAPRAVLTAGHCAAAVRIRALDGATVDVVARTPAPGRLDAAVLTLATSLAITARPRARALDAPTDGRVRVLGFGADDARGTTGAGLARWGELYVDDWRCDGARAARTGCRPGLEVIIAGDGVDACRGDSGGPVVDWTDGGWRLIGLTSRGLPGAPTPCGHGGIYVHVGALAAWLDSFVKEP